MKHLKTYRIFEEDAYYSAMTSGQDDDTPTYGPQLYEGKPIAIPDKVAVWFMSYYAAETKTLIKAESIPEELFKASKSLVKDYAHDGYIYKGFSVPMGFVKSDMEFDTKGSLSWTYDPETAEAFASKAKDKGMQPAVAKIKLSKLSRIVSMDVVFDNITEKQVKLIKDKEARGYIEEYISESEVLCFETVSVKAKDITLL